MPDENILENIEDVYPMSDIEKGMVFHSIKESHISQFHNQLMNQVKVTDFSPGVFKKALLLMIKKHIILRTTFDMYGYEEPVQLVHKGMSPDYQHFDISHLDKSCREEYINNILKEDREKSFDINSINPLWRMKSFKLDEKNVCILWLSHHALMDGWSRATFLTDLNNTYMKLKTNPDYTPPGLKSSYKDFVIEQIMCKKNEKFIEFWQKELEDYKRYEFPPNAARIGIEDHRYLYKNYTRHYEEPFVEKLNAAARRYDTSIKHLCFSAFSYMLTMISYEDDITVGLLVNNRPVCEDGDKIVGCFLNSIPVRMKIPARVKWSDYIRTMDQKMIQLIKYGKLSLNEIVKVIGERHQPDQHNPIFDTLFNYTDFHVYSQVDRENIAAPGKAEQLSLDLRLSSNIPFNFDVGYSGYMSVTLSSANEIVSSELTANLLCYFENILKQFIYEPESIAGKEQVLPLEEKQKLLYDFNNTKTDFPNDKTIPQLFAAVVEQEPHRIALAFENHQLTYRVLSEKANGLARRLKEKGIGPNNITGIMMERSLEMVIGIYGILNAGSAYLPIDPNYPAERVLYIMQDSESQILLTREYFRQNVIFNGETINISNELEYPNNRGGLESMNTPGDPVYVIYTSGSTGKPKGVMVKIESFVNLIHWYAEEFAFNHEDRVLLIASISFDLAQKNLFSPLIKGGQLFLASPGFYDYHQLSDTAAKKRVSIINCAPTMFYPLIEFNISRDFSRLKSLRYVFLGGEPIQVEKLMPWLDSDACQAEIVNTYGPTECTDIASFYRINPGNLKDRQTVPIGKPIHNVSIYILDKNHHLLPIGVVGELCIGGIGLSRGYYKQPELTKEKFVHTPHLPEQHVYCTGDMARWRKDGHIEFMGRIDHQVKIRGNRVELGEIETRLQKHESIKDAVVTIIEKSFPDGNKNEILCAYIVSAKEFDFSQLKEFLSKQLPEYMIPSYFVSLEALPLTPSGKVDRKKLPHPDIVSTPRYTPPGNEIEKKLVEIWADLLSVEKDTLSIDADFFDLGGHSLSAMRLVSILSNTFNVKIPLRNFFQSGTIGNISEVIIKLKAEKNNEKEPTRKRKGLVRTFNLEQAPLFRAVAVKLQEGQHLLFFDMHHIITDGASMEVIADDFVRVYAGEPLPPLPLQYKEFAQWQNNFFDSEDYQEQQEYWLNCYQGKIPGLNLPYDHPEPKIRKRKGDNLRFHVKGELAGRIRRLIDQRQVTSFMFLLAAYKLLLAKYSNQEDIVVGIPVSGRTHIDTDQLVGFFVNTLAIRSWPENRLNFYEYLEQVRTRCLEAFDNQDYQFEMLVEKLGFSGESQKNPLFNTMFTWGSTTRKTSKENRRLKDDRTKIRRFNPKNTTVVFDLVFSTTVSDDDIQGLFAYDIDLFEKKTIENIVLHFKNLLSWVSYYPGKPIREIDMTVPAAAASLANPVEPVKQPEPGEENSRPGDSPERELSNEEPGRILSADFYDTAREYPQNKKIHQLFAQQVNRTPDHIAVVGPGTDAKAGAVHELNLQVTYRKLNETSNQLAYLLKASGVGADSITGIMVERSPDMIIGILGILKTGGAYLPIDPDYPEERIKYMLADSSARVLVTTSTLVKKSEKLKKHDSKKNHEIVLLDTVDASHLHPSTFPPGPPSQSSLAYTIYTSGSTGRSRGVLIEHYSVINLIYCQQQRFNINESDRILQFSSICFDASVEQIFLALLNGAVLVLINKKTLLDITRFETYISLHAITHIHAVPSFLNNLNMQGLAHVKRLISGGDVCPASLAGKWCSDYEFYNEYGPTETTVTSIESLISAVDDSLVSVPIGRPLDNTTVYIVDRWKKAAAPGVAGELYIGGDGVARGYLNNPELTAEKFNHDLWDYQDYQDKRKKIPGKNSMQPCNHAIMQYHSPSPHHPITPLSHSPIYRTGDLARWLPDGNIEFLGRIDDQVKIRGFRIELGEIETQLLKHQDIKEAVVVSQRDVDVGIEGEDGDKFLCAYIVPEDPLSREDFNGSDLREFLSLQLPGYMIPSFFVFLQELPLTPSGKVNRQSLPAPKPGVKTGYIAPGNKMEERLVEIWAGALRIEKKNIGIDDNFFQLGGHSLKGAVIISKVHKEFNVRISLEDIFKNPDIRRLSPHIKASVRERYISIEKEEKKEYYPLSSAQKRLYVVHRMDPGSISYNIVVVYEMEKDVNFIGLEDVVKKLIKRHESFRTSFLVIGEEPVQRIHEYDELEFMIEYYDLATGEENYKGDSTPGPLGITNQKETGTPHSSSIIHHFVRPFDLTHAPLMRVGVIKNRENKPLLMIDMHHIISDGTSVGTFKRELTGFYRSKQLPSLNTRYKDYSKWQQGGRNRRELEVRQAYWLEAFSGELPALNLPVDYLRPRVKDFTGNTITFQLEKQQLEELTARARQGNVTLYMIILSIYTILLSKLSSQEEVIVGTPAAGRGGAELESIIGMFVNTLALRLYPGGEKTWWDFLTEVKTTTLNAFENQAYQFEELVGHLAVERDASRNPLFDVMFALQNLEDNDIVEQTPELTPYKYHTNNSKFDMVLVGEEVGEGLDFDWEYSTKLFKEESIKRFIGYFRKIVYEVTRDPGKKISEIEIISQREKRKLLYDFNLNDRRPGYPVDKTIHQLYEEQAKKNPDLVAVVGWLTERFMAAEGGGGGGGEIKDPLIMSISFEELNHRSNQLAKVLMKSGVKPNTIVGLMVERSIRMMVGIIAILKAGAAYLPISPHLPGARKKYMLADSNASLLLTQKSIGKNPGFSFPGEILYLEDEGICLPPGGEPGEKTAGGFKDFAYVIYTSGSTGNPKGVAITHMNVSPLLYWGYECMGFGPADRTFQNLSYHFDWSVWEIFITLTSGVCLYLVSDDIMSDPRSQIDFLMEHQVTILHITPTHLQYLIKPGRKLTSLSYLVIGAESLTFDLVKQCYELISSDCRVFNMYGPTETTIISSVLELGRRDQDEAAYMNLSGIPIGEPVGNAKLLVLDRNLKLCPLNVPGELFIAGDGVARGYLSDPEKSSNSFIKNIYQKEGIKGKHLYKTGDLVRWLWDGTIEFLGRLDQQIKIRGFRIEPGEIEKHLLRYEGIEAVVVMVRKLKKSEQSEDIDRYLCAYIVSGIEFEVPALIEFLSQELPGYMIPAFFVRIDRVPMTANGKVEWQSLPEPGIMDTGKDYAPPGDEIETKLVELWSGTLGLEKEIISIDENFFQLGGHSLKGTVLISKIHKVFNVKISAAVIYENPTIRQLARYLKKIDREPGETAEKKDFKMLKCVEEKEYYPTSSPQKRLFILNQLDTDNVRYNSYGALLIEGDFDKEKFDRTLQQLIRRHESLRTSFKMEAGEIIQQVHKNPHFSFQCYEAVEAIDPGDTTAIEKIIKGSIELRPIEEPTAGQTLSTIQLVKKKRRKKDV